MTLPLEGIKIIELSHMVMGPTVGVVLADLGADVIKVEPVGGDNTRRLRGSGAGYFPMYNRNKKSLAINLKSEAGKAAVLKLIESADIFIENFRPGALDKLGFGYDALSNLNPRLIYCSEKGFLSGPYEHRTALDEVTQMMGGLSYMTGPPGRPLRAGASVIDVTGGMFGAIGILAALEQRRNTGKGQKITASLFETTAFLVGQHMAQMAVTGTPAAPMPARVSAWAIYDVFDTKDDDKVFVGVVSDSQWRIFCDAFGLDDLGSNAAYDKNADRVGARDNIMPIVREKFATFTKSELMDKLEKTGLPFAPISRPEDLFDDPHLNASGGLVEMEMEDGNMTKLPALPVAVNDERLGLRLSPPKIGEHNVEVLKSAGLSDADIAAMVKSGDLSS